MYKVVMRTIYTSANTLTEDPDYPDIQTRSFRSVLSGYPYYPYYSDIRIIRISDYHEITDCICINRIYNNLSDGKYTQEI